MREYELRAAVTLGGFLILAGITMVGVSSMASFGFVDLIAFENQEYRTLSLWILLAVGIFDLLSGILFRRK